MPDFSPEWITDEASPRTLVVRRRSSIDADLLVTADFNYINERTGEVQHHFARGRDPMCRATPQKKAR